MEIEDGLQYLKGGGYWTGNWSHARSQIHSENLLLLSLAIGVYVVRTHANHVNLRQRNWRFVYERNKATRQMHSSWRYHANHANHADRR